MKEQLQRFMDSKLRKELQRLIPILAVSGLILIPDASFGIILFVIGSLLVTAAVSHIIRKVLLPYLDLERLMDRADETPMSAAIVFCGVMYIMAEFIRFAAVLLGH